MLNQFAWLVANTQGDVQAALESSRRSLELIPDDPGYLDTLGRCYFAAGDLEMPLSSSAGLLNWNPTLGRSGDNWSCLKRPWRSSGDRPPPRRKFPPPTESSAVRRRHPQPTTGRSTEKAPDVRGPGT